MLGKSSLWPLSLMLTAVCHGEEAPKLDCAIHGHGASGKEMAVIR